VIAPFSVENSGNAIVNVNISATGLWSTQPNPSNYFKVKVRESSETGSFNLAGSQTSWTQMPSLNNSVMISKLNYSDSVDSAKVDVSVMAPSGEPIGTKSARVNFLAGLGE
jgi:hypothetical protein